jgi:hypothetical protein
MSERRLVLRRRQIEVEIVHVHLELWCCWRLKNSEQSQVGTTCKDEMLFSLIRSDSSILMKGGDLDHDFFRRMKDD